MLRKKVEQDSACGVRAACGCCRPFSGMRGGASCALHLAVDALVCCLGTGEGPDVLRKKVEQDSACGVRAACGCCRPFSGMRGGASCALHLAVDCIRCGVWGLEKALMCSERRWSRIQHVG